MFHPITEKENNGLQDIQNQKKNIHRREGEEGEKCANWIRAFHS